jgi:hypothetical protein
MRLDFQMFFLTQIKRLAFQSWSLGQGSLAIGEGRSVGTENNTGPKPCMQVINSLLQNSLQWLPTYTAISEIETEYKFKNTQPASWLKPTRTFVIEDKKVTTIMIFN